MWNNQNLFIEKYFINFSWSQLQGGRPSSPYWSLVSDTIADSTYAQLSFCAQTAVRWYPVNNIYALAGASWLTINCLPSGRNSPSPKGRLFHGHFTLSWHSTLNMQVIKTEYWISTGLNVGLLNKFCPVQKGNDQKETYNEGALTNERIIQ